MSHKISDTAYYAGMLVSLGGVSLAHLTPSCGLPDPPTWVITLLAAVFLIGGASLLFRAFYLEDNK